MFSELIKVVIIDDEDEARDLLVNLLHEIDFVKILGTAADADQALTKIIDHEPDLIFLDIEMPEKDAFFLLKEVKSLGLQVDVIMVTGYKKYALDAIKEHVIDYLVKPVARLELLRSLVFFKRLNKKKFVTPVRNSKLKIATRTGKIFLDPDQILYFEAESNYTHIYMVDNSSEVCSSNLGRMEELCDDRFIRISRSHIINLDYLYKINRKMRLCVLQDGSKEIILSIPQKNLKLL